MGEISQFSDQLNSMLKQLASLSVSGSSSAASSESYPLNSLPVQPVPTYAGVLSAPKSVIFTINDVRSLPRLTGNADADVAEVLSQFRLVVGFRRAADLSTAPVSVLWFEDDTSERTPTYLSAAEENKKARLVLLLVLKK